MNYCKRITVLARKKCGQKWQKDNYEGRFCNALIMITGVIKTFAIYRLYHFHWL